jgi:hypothetical protein
LRTSPRLAKRGPLYIVTTTSNPIEHTTTFDDGRIHATFTQTGTFVAVPLEDPSPPSYTGKFTVWGGFNQNGKTVNGTLTFTTHGTGSDGSTFKNHTTDHFIQRPDGHRCGFVPLGACRPLTSSVRETIRVIA